MSEMKLHIDNEMKPSGVAESEKNDPTQLNNEVGSLFSEGGIMLTEAFKRGIKRKLDTIRRRILSEHPTREQRDQREVTRRTEHIQQELTTMPESTSDQESSNRQVLDQSNTTSYLIDRDAPANKKSFWRRLVDRWTLDRFSPNKNPDAVTRGANLVMNALDPSGSHRMEMVRRKIGPIIEKAQTESKQLDKLK